MTNRRDFLFNFTMAVGAVSFFRPLNVFASTSIKPQNLPGRHSLSILHTSDLSFFWPEINNKKTSSGFDGFLNAAKKLEEFRNEGLSCLAVHTSCTQTVDQLSIEPHAHLYKKMFSAGYDAVLPGKPPGLNGDAPVNYLEGTLGHGRMASEIVTKGNYRIGLIKLEMFGTNDMQQKDLVAAAAVITKTARQYRKANGCRMVVCVVRADKSVSVKLAALSSGVDALLSSAINNTPHTADILRNKDNSEVILSYACSNGMLMNRIDFRFDNSGEKIFSATNAIFNDSKNNGYVAALKRFNTAQV